MCCSSFVRSTSKHKQQLRSCSKQSLPLKVSMETVPELRLTVLGQRKRCQQQQGERLLKPREQDGQSSRSNHQRQTASPQTQDYAGFQRQVESVLLLQLEQDGH